MKNSLLFIFFFIAKFMKSENDVELDEKSDINQTIKNLLQLKNRISVFNDDVVKFSVIYIYLNTSLKFVNKDH